MPPKRYQRKRISRNIKPLKLDTSVNFNSVGGLEEHIKCLREMVLFPLMYPDLFKRFNSRPPKGVLFHGPPGTGKTLLARALANECSRMRGRKVAFFMRKGADVMSKWYGESEKHVKNLFQQANKMRPSIIFFDEIDALAPVRSGSQGEVYASVVATLLVEMDGLWDRGEVIVIGATNRLDCLEPALRRAGRFDRELHFPPPGLLARRHILSVCTRRWLPRPADDVVDYIAQITNGYLGSDLNALCSEAVLRALRRVYPQVYERDYYNFSSIDTKKVEVTVEDLLSAKRSLLPARTRLSPIAAKHLPEACEPLLRGQVQEAAALLKQAFPSADPSQGDVISPGVFLVSGECAETHIAPALLAQLEHCTVLELSMMTLHSQHCYSQERAILAIFSECRHSDRSSVVFVPDIAAVWDALSCAGAAVLLRQWRTGAAGDDVLLLATCPDHYNDLNSELQDLFPAYKDCVYRVRDPTQDEVINFLMPIISQLPAPAAGEKCECAPADTVASTSATVVQSETGSRKRRYLDILVYTKGLNFKRARYNDMEEPAISITDTDSSLDEPKEDENEFCPDLAKILKANADALCRIGLEALTDLHAQLCKTFNARIRTSERMRLHKELHNITLRYLKVSKIKRD